MDRFEVYKEAELHDIWPSAHDKKEKKRMEESAGFWPGAAAPESWGDELTPLLMFFTAP